MRQSARLSVAALAVIMLVIEHDGRLISAAAPPGPIVRKAGGFAPREHRPDADYLPTPPHYYLDKPTSPAFRTRLLLQQTIKFDFPNPTAFDEVLKYIKGAVRDRDGKSLSIYVDPVGLQEAETTMKAPVVAQFDGVRLEKSLDLVLLQLGLMYDVRDDGLLVITALGCNDGSPRYAGEWIEIEVEQLGIAVSTLRAELERAVPAGAPITRPSSATVRTVQERAISGDDAGLDFERIRTPHFEVLRKMDPATAGTWLALRKTIRFSARKLPLAKALEQFHEATAAENRNLTIYVDPFGLREAEKDVTSIVDLEIEDVPAASVLELMLKQLGLTYFVDRDGLIRITCESNGDEADEETDDERDTKTLNAVVALRREVNMMRWQLSLLRRSRRVSNAVGSPAVPAPERSAK